MRVLLILYLLFVLNSCNQSAQNANAIKTDTTRQLKTKTSSVQPPTFDNVHPNAKQRMSDSFFFDVVEESAPFGSDDGSEAYTGFNHWRKNHPTESPVDFLKQQINYWNYPGFDIEETNFEKLHSFLKDDEMNVHYMTGIDQAIVAIAFGQLYLEGTINNDIKELAKKSLKRELLPEVLKSWGNYGNTRRANLNKLLTVLTELK